MNKSRLSRQEISEAVGDLGWRLILGELVTQVRTESLAQAASVAASVSSGLDAGDHLRIDLRPDRLYLSVTTLAESYVTPTDIELARKITPLVSSLGLTTDGGLEDESFRSVQRLELAIDALDIPTIRPFWRAVMGYTDERGDDAPDVAVVDPAGQGPAIWFQQMDAPRPQRNRIHFDITVPHDEALRRMDAAIAAGGKLLSDDYAPAFWVLADHEGNEICICTWQARDT
jgi:4a-hydroxytetrahydrobiopterin dehydratase